MTVAIGLVCSDGVLVAADSMASDPPTAHKVQKVFKLDCCPVVWTASGSIYVIEEVQQALAGIDRANEKTGEPPAIFAKPDLPNLRAKLKNTITPKMRECYGSALSTTPFPPGSTAPSFATTFLACGFANETPWLLEVAVDGQINWHTDFGFYAIGSGGPFATVARGLMAHYLDTPLTLEQGKLVAYRAIETTCEVSPGGVGLPVRMAVVDKEGAKVLSDAEIEQIGYAVTRWKTLEVDTLLMTSDAAKATAKGDLPSIEAD